MPSFDVTSTDVQRFRKFIGELRAALRLPDRPFVMQDAARLPSQVDNPGQMELVLRADNRAVTLVLRTDNLYVIGFRNDAGQAYEFLHDNGRSPMIQGSQLLPFNGSYTGGIAPLDESEAILGQEAVRNAINLLSAYNGVDSAQARRALRVLIVNFIESVRLNDIADRVDSQMRNPHGSIEDRRLTDRNVRLIRDWGRLSSALTIAINNVDEEGPGTSFFRDFAAIGISNAYKAAVALGMVLADRHHRPRRSVSSTSGSGDDDIDTGATIVEFIGVLINDIDGEDPGDLYGTVSITDCFGTVNMFDRDRSSTQSVGPGGWADLTWPPRAVSGADDFAIDVHLMDRDSFPDLSPDDEVARGQLFWNSRDALSRDCGAVQTKQVKGPPHSSVEVHYAVLNDAVVAAVSVVMLDGDGENVPDVYGTIKANTRIESGELLQYSLFDRERDQDVGVPRNTAVPLKRSVVSAELGSELQVQVDLWDRDSFPDLSPDDQIVQGSVTFRPSVQGIDNADIEGPDGKVRVEVTWSVSFTAP